MLQGTTILNDIALFLINVAFASVVICTSVILAATVVRRRALPLRHTVLLSSAFFVLSCPASSFWPGSLVGDWFPLN